jgi:hypothetical protein
LVSSNSSCSNWTRYQLILTKGTSSPFSIISVSSFPRSDPDATSALSRSPVDRWVKPYFCTILSHWVPLPLPGPPMLRHLKMLLKIQVGVIV